MSNKTKENHKPSKKFEGPREGPKAEFALPLPKSWSGSPNRKMWKAQGGHRLHKKAPFKPGVLFKVNPQLISQIPRAVLLTPSSSDNSVAASSSNGSVAAYLVTPQQQPPKEEPKIVHTETNKGAALTRSILPVPACMALQRQRTAAILKFRSRKSLSQMDIKEARRTGNFPLPKPPLDSRAQALVPLQAQPSQLAANMVSLQHGLDTAPYSLLESYFGGAAPVDMHTASLRIFNTIMLHAWRKRREEVRLLNDQIEDVKRANIKNKNQLHVYNSLFRVEQRRNEQLNEQLRRTYQDVATVRNTIDDLRKENTRLKLGEDVLKQQLLEKFQDCENFSSMLENTKTELFQAMSKERETLTLLSDSQRKIQQLESEQAELMRQLAEMAKLLKKAADETLAAVKEREEALVVVNEELANCLDFQVECKKKDEQLLAAKQHEEQLQYQLDLLQSEMRTLQQCLAATFGNRLKNCFNHKVSYQVATYQMLHWVAFYMLPATPPPRVTSLPVGVAIKKVKAFFTTNSRAN